MNPLNPRFPGPSAHDFAKVPRIETKRSGFKAESRIITMFDEGKLIPLPPIEVIPGDTISLDASMLCRINTPLVPTMSGFNLHSAWFFVPFRILWDNWERFMGAKDNPSDSTTYTIPVVTGPAAGFAVESVYDYMGIPIDKTKNVNALPLRAYNLIYNENFRAQLIINSATVNKGNGPDTDTNYTVRRVAKYFDYFTGCLPAPQYGAAQSFSMTGEAPVKGIGKSNQTFSVVNQNVYETDGTGTVQYPTSSGAVSANAPEFYFYVRQDASNPGFPDLRTDLQGVSAFTIAEFRETLQLQALAEIENRGGQRYVEILYSVYGVVSPDFRHSKPEYLGGSKTPIYIVPVPQTSQTSGSEAQGQLAAYGSGFKTGDGFTKSFTEHGVIIPLVWVRTDASNVYHQNLHRMWTRSTKYDFFNPYLQNIGDQAVLRQEIYLADNDSASDNTVFGYQERYSEYMFLPSFVTGKLRPAYSAPYDYWHASPELSGAPTLSQTFIEEDAPMDRIVTVTTEPDFVMDCYINATMVRPMAMHSIPGFMPVF